VCGILLAPVEWCATRHLVQHLWSGVPPGIWYSTCGVEHLWSGVPPGIWYSTCRVVCHPAFGTAAVCAKHLTQHQWGCALCYWHITFHLLNGIEVIDCDKMDGNYPWSVSLIFKTLFLGAQKGKLVVKGIYSIYCVGHTFLCIIFFKIWGIAKNYFSFLQNGKQK